MCGRRRKGTAGLVSATPAAAAGYEHFQQVTCWKLKYTRTSWSGSCSVPFGHARAVVECADGKIRKGAWTGRGTWKFGMSCGKSRMGAMNVETKSK